MQRFLPRCIVCNAVLLIAKPSVCLSVRLSVCLSVTHVIYCDKTNESSADNLSRSYSKQDKFQVNETQKKHTRKRSNSNALINIVGACAGRQQRLPVELLIVDPRYHDIYAMFPRQLHVRRVKRVSHEEADILHKRYRRSHSLLAPASLH